MWCSTEDDEDEEDDERREIVEKGAHAGGATHDFFPPG